MAKLKSKKRNEQLEFKSFEQSSDLIWPWISYSLKDCVKIEF